MFSIWLPIWKTLYPDFVMVADDNHHKIHTRANAGLRPTLDISEKSVVNILFRRPFA